MRGLLPVVAAGALLGLVGLLRLMPEMEPRVVEFRVIAQTLERYQHDGDAKRVVSVAISEFPRGKLSYMLLLPLLLGESNERGLAFAHLAYVEISNEAISRVYADEAEKQFVSTGDDLHRSFVLMRRSQLEWKNGKYTLALELADRALDLLATLGPDVKNTDEYQDIETRAYIARIDPLRRVGDHEEALATFEAVKRGRPRKNYADWLLLKEAMLLAEQGQEPQALVLLGRIEASSPLVLLQVSVNRALLQKSRYKQAMAIAAEAQKLNGGPAADLELVKAFIEASKPDLEAAGRHLKAAMLLAPPDEDWPWEIAHAWAELLEANWNGRNLVEAEHHYRRAIAEVETLRTSAESHCAYLMESHRAPYDGLISLLARQSRWREAVEVVLLLDASDMLRAAARRPHLKSASVALNTALDSSASHDVVILIARREREISVSGEPDHAYRIRIHDKAITGEDIGEAVNVRLLAREFAGSPSDRELAKEVGRFFVPAGQETSTLQVLTFGALNEVPLNALRGENGLLISAVRPLVRIPALQTETPTSSDGGGSLILADPVGDLPEAEIEGTLAAAKIHALLPERELRVAGHGRPLQATRALLLSSRQLSVLHVAAHAVPQGGWRKLLLSDGNVGPVDLLKNSIAPRLAILAACGSRAAKDGGGWGSIAAAFIEAGTWRALATDKNVLSSVSQRLVESYYSQEDWYSDPERALGRAQQILDNAGVPANDWSSFTMMGRPPFVVESRTTLRDSRAPSSGLACVH